MLPLCIFELSYGMEGFVIGLSQIAPFFLFASNKSNQLQYNCLNVFSNQSLAI